jgi:hypothetical protein
MCRGVRACVWEPRAGTVSGCRLRSRDRSPGVYAGCGSPPRVTHRHRGALELVGCRASPASRIPTADPVGEQLHTSSSASPSAAVEAIYHGHGPMVEQRVVRGLLAQVPRVAQQTPALSVSREAVAQSNRRVGLSQWHFRSASTDVL